MNNHPSSPVTGSDHHNRVNEKRTLLERAKRKEHTNLSAARRTGKTSLMREIMHALKAQGWIAVEIDFASCKTVEAFFDRFEEKLLDAVVEQKPLQTKWKNTFKAAKEQLNRSISIGVVGLGNLDIGQKQTPEKQSSEAAAAWLKPLEQVLRELANLAPAKQLVMGIDELPIFFAEYLKSAASPAQYQHYLQTIESILYMFRTLRQMDKNPCFWIHCSSIGLESFASIHQMTHALSGLEPLHLEAFSEEDTIEMLQKLWKGKHKTDDFPTDVAEHMINKIRWLVPSFTQLLFHEIWDGQTNRDLPWTTQLVDEAYARLISPNNSIKFQHWHDRLDLQLPPESANIARTVLDMICSRQTLVSGTVLFNKISTAGGTQVLGNIDLEALDKTLRTLLGVLERDGYLVSEEQKNGVSAYQFRSPFLRDYWEKNCMRKTINKLNKPNKPNKPRSTGKP